MSALPIRSLFVPSMTVRVDPWAANPLLDDARQSVPQTVAAATAANGDAPTMFESGDLPPFTASGVDPQVLMRLPWRFRHAAAMERDPARVLAWIEQHGYDSTAELPSTGLEDYIVRFRGWLRGSWTNPSFTAASPAQVAETEGALYDALFGTEESATAAAKAGQIAAEQQFTALRTRTGQYADGIGRSQR